jgi:hypothetical protein
LWKGEGLDKINFGGEMSDLKKVAAAAKKLVFSEIEKYGTPEPGAFKVAVKKASELAESLGVDREIVLIGVYLMDVKAGQAFREGTSSDHVKMSVDEARRFLKPYRIGKDIEGKIINCIEAHHGSVPYICKEAEIVSNADCYQFLHPQALFYFVHEVDIPLEEFIKLLKGKVEEKWDKLSLGICKKELEPYYQAIKTLLAAV